MTCSLCAGTGQVVSYNRKGEPVGSPRTCSQCKGTGSIPDPKPAKAGR